MINTIIAWIMALLQFAGITVGIIPYETDIDYGGTKYVAPVVTEWMTIAENNESDYVIVIGSNAKPAEITASEEMNAYIKRICGVNIPVVRDTAAAIDTEIIVGKTNRNNSLNYSSIIEPLVEDSFILKTYGKKVVIAGQGERGTLYGAYAFLEEQLGVRFLTPTVDYIPEKSIVKINAELNDSQSPSFPIRRVLCPGVNDKYYATSRTNVPIVFENEKYGGGITYTTWDVSMNKFVPDSLYATHPEYFAYREDQGKTVTDHVCLSNDGVLQETIARADEMLKNDPMESDHLHIGQKDNDTYCQCAKCTELSEQYGSLSAPMVIFSNKLSDALKQKGYTDLTVTFFAYIETKSPPTKGGLKCNKDVVPVICGSIVACHSHPYEECGMEDESEFDLIERFSKPETKFADEVKGWIAVAERTYVYEYSINFLLNQQFFNNFATLQKNAKWMKEVGITGFTYTCGDGHISMLNELRSYLISKIYWNVDCDVEYYMMDFLNHYYGESAAKYIKNFIDLQTAKLTEVEHAFTFDWHYQMGFFTPTEIHKMNDWFKKAYKTNLTDEQKFRVETVELGWRFYKANLFIDEYFFLSPWRPSANEKLYDDFVSHGITYITSLSGPFPPKDKIDFVFPRPISWKT